MNWNLGASHLKFAAWDGKDEKEGGKVGQTLQLPSSSFLHSVVHTLDSPTKVSGQKRWRILYNTSVIYH
jgi:hypothetical protein